MKPWKIRSRFSDPKRLRSGQQDGDDVAVSRAFMESHRYLDGDASSHTARVATLPFVPLWPSVSHTLFVGCSYRELPVFDIVQKLTLNKSRRS